MKRYISTTVEDAPEGLYLAAEYKDKKRKTSKGNTVICCDIVRPYKKVILFDEEGEMTVKYYTKAEWNGTNVYVSENYRKPKLIYRPCFIDSVAFKAWLNSQLEDVSIKEIINDLNKGLYCIDPKHLDSNSQELIKKIMKSPDDCDMKCFEVITLDDLK